MLQNRDFTIIIDKSGSMATPDMPNGKSRWAACQESVLALATKVEQFDPDGLTVYAFNNSFKRYENVTAAKVSDVFKENEPQGGTDLDGVLSHALNDYFTRKSAGTTKANGDLIIVVTDGEPNDRKAVSRVIVEATKKMDKDEELAIGFIQIGKDGAAQQFLKSLDDDLTGQGAKFDIVDAQTADDLENRPFTESLEKMITD